MLRRLTLVAGLAALACPGVAAAGAPGSWTQVTDGSESNTLEVGLARTSNGVLHVAWQRKNGSNEDLVHTPISSTGAQGAASAIVTSFASLSPPALVTDGASLTAFFGGIRSTSSSDPNQNMNLAGSSDGGGSWSLAPGTVVTGGAAYAAATSATIGPGGITFEAWGGTFVHRGLAPTDPNNDFQAPLGGCCGYDPNIGFDPVTGSVVVAWYSNATGKLGLWAQGVDPATGAPTGGAQNMPGTVTGGNSSQQLNRTPLAVRAGGGIFAAYPGGYPTTTQVLLWRVGTGSSTTIATNAAGIAHVAVAAAPDGRLWVLWTQSSPGGFRVYARRSNPTVTSWEPTISVNAPPGTGSAYRLEAAAQADRVDVLGHFGIGSGIATWHTQLRPGGGGTYTGPTKTIKTTVDDQQISFNYPNGCVSPGQKIVLRVTSKPYRVFRGRHPHATFRSVQFLIDKKVKATRRRKPYATTVSTKGLKVGRHSVWARMALNRHFPNGRNVKLTKTLKATFSIC